MDIAILPASSRPRASGATAGKPLHQAVVGGVAELPQKKHARPQGRRCVQATISFVSGRAEVTKELPPGVIGCPRGPQVKLSALLRWKTAAHFSGRRGRYSLRGKNRDILTLPSHSLKKINYILRQRSEQQGVSRPGVAAVGPGW